MKIYIMVDLEGISGIHMRAQVMAAEPKYAEGRALLTREVNICASACKNNGCAHLRGLLWCLYINHTIIYVLRQVF